MTDEIAVISVDQWTQTGNINHFTFAELRDAIEADGVEALQSIEGGDAEAARAIFGGRIDVKTVDRDATPKKGMVWYVEDDDGELEKFKTNYATK